LGLVQVEEGLGKEFAADVAAGFGPFQRADAGLPDCVYRFLPATAELPDSRQSQ
jgi:hypothetical protein